MSMKITRVMKRVGSRFAALAFITAGSVLATDNVGTGGTITYTDAGGALVGAPVAGGDVIHTFTSSGTLNVPLAASADVLVVAGGGGGGGSTGGGGGAGGYIFSNSFPVVNGSNYQVTVGMGGGGSSGFVQGTNGGSSVFGSLTAYGGGGGGANVTSGVIRHGLPGGSGGGASHDNTTDGTGGSCTNGQGNLGGNTIGWGASYFTAAGGGGGGTAGTNGISQSGGAGGGAGVQYSISGSNTWYCGGGGGGVYQVTGNNGGGLGGSGIGGRGGCGPNSPTQPTRGAVNTGSGGGGQGGNVAAVAGSGGSGIVIVRYPYDPGTFSIGLTSPANNQIFNSTTSVSATANVFLATPPCTVKFYLDGNLVSKTDNAPATVTVDLGVLANGPHTVEATATDSTLTTVSSGIRPFTVDGIHPTLAPTGIVDNKSGGTVTTPALVTYTVTFSEDMDASTVSAASFGNAGTAAVTIGTVTETTPTSGVFTVPVTATGAGPLQLKVNAGAVLNDAVGNALDTTSAILDDTTITVVGPPETLYWANQTTGNFLWTDVNQWRTVAAPAPHAAPVNGDTIEMPNYSLQNFGIDVAGANLNLPASTFVKVNNVNRAWTFYDSATLTPNNSPPSPQTNFTPVTAGQTLVQAANASTQVLTLSQVTGQKSGYFYYYIPISVSGNMKFQENAIEHYYGNVSAGGVLATDNTGWTTDVYFHSGITISGTFIQPYRSGTLGDGQQLFLEGPININTMDHQGGEIYISSTASGTYTNYNLKNGWLYNASSAITVSNMNWTGGSYFANGSSALASLGSSVTVPTNSALSIGVAQSSLPTMTTVSAYGSLAGNMTGASYSGGGKNVTLNENAVFGGTGVVPTRADIGGAKLYMGIANGSTGGPYVVGDDGSTSIYKGFAFGNAWTTSATFNKQLTAVGGDLAGYISYVGLNNDTNNIWMGDGTSHTANVKFSPSGYLNLKYGFNVGQSGANLITTFNLTRDAAGAEMGNLLVFSATTGKILAGQTVNVSKGSIGTTQNLRNGGLLGTLTLSNGVFAQPTSAFTALDTGKLHFGDRAVVDLTLTNNLGYLEALGTDDVTCSGRPIALLYGSTAPTINNLNLGANQVLAKVLGSCDLIWNSYLSVTFTSDLPVGHARFAYNCWDRTDSARGLYPKVGTEKITYAANAPAGETPWIGFAATAQSLTIGMAVDAPAAIVQCGTDDPTRLVRPGAFTGVTANNTVTFTNTVTAAGIRILSGTAAFSKDLSTTNLQIGAGAILDANSKIFTITGTVSGGGTAQECANLTFSTVAPGVTNGCGNLTWSTANSFKMPANATYEWGMAATNTAGVTYDLITASKAIFGGAWTLKLVNNGFTNVLDGTEVFKIIDGTAAAPAGFVAPTIIAPDTGYKVSGASVSVVGYDVFLTGVTGTWIPPPKGTLISFQ